MLKISVLVLFSVTLSACSARPDLVPCKTVYDCTKYPCETRTICDGKQVN